MRALRIAWRIYFLIGIVAAAIDMWSPDPAWIYRLTATLALTILFFEYLMEIFGVRLVPEARS